jgi:tRNA-specific 2-thiouridylase
VGKVRLPEFLQQKLAPKTGKVIEVPADAARFAVLAGEGDSDMDELCAPYVYEESDGKVVGEHRGAHYYTIGQRKGLNIGGTPLPLFIIGTDTTTNTIYTGQGEDHPGLYRPGLFIDREEVHWVREDLRMEIGESRRYQVRIRYRQDLEAASLYMREKGLYILFDQPQKAIAAGQFAVWYDGEELIGSGVIG